MREDAWPEIGNADELHDALVVHGFLDRRTKRRSRSSSQRSQQQRRVTRLQLGGGRRRATSRPSACTSCGRCSRTQRCRPAIEAVPPDGPTREEALREILRGRLELLGPVDRRGAGRAAGPERRRRAAGLAAARSRRRGDARRLHRRRCGRMVRPPPAGAHPPRHARQAARRDSSRCRRRSSCASCSAGTSLPTARATSAARAKAGWPTCCASSKAMPRRPRPGKKTCWRRASTTTCPPCWTSSAPSAASCGGGRPRRARRPAARRGPIRGTPVLLCERDALRALAAGGRRAGGRRGRCCPARARQVLEVLRTHGASFFADLQHDARLLGTQVEQALAELVAHGLVTCDSFAGLRALVMPEDKRNQLRRKRGAHDPIDDAGRWSLTRRARAGGRCAGRAGRAARRAHRPRAAAPLWRGVPQAAGARGRPAAVARPVLRAAPAGSARRGARRPLRQRLLRRAVRAAGSRRGAAQDRARRRAASAWRSRRSIR